MGALELDGAILRYLDDQDLLAQFSLSSEKVAEPELIGRERLENRHRRLELDGVSRRETDHGQISLSIVGINRRVFGDLQRGLGGCGNGGLDDGAIGFANAHEVDVQTLALEVVPERQLPELLDAGGTEDPGPYLLRAASASVIGEGVRCGHLRGECLPGDRRRRHLCFGGKREQEGCESDKEQGPALRSVHIWYWESFGRGDRGRSSRRHSTETCGSPSPDLLSAWAHEVGNFCDTLTCVDCFSGP